MQVVVKRVKVSRFLEFYAAAMCVIMTRFEWSTRELRALCFPVNRLVCAALFVLLLASAARAYEVAPVRVLTDRVIVVVVRDGTVKVETLGSGIDGKVESAPSDISKLERLRDCRLLDVGTGKVLAAERIGRKSKGTQFTRMDEWKIESVRTHWVYVCLKEPLQRGHRYQLTAPWIEGSKSFRFDDETNRSEVVQVNQLGYRTDVHPKSAFLSHWMGTAGGLNLDDYAKRSFHLREVESNKVVFSGKPKRRMRATESEDAYESNFRLSDLWELDFSEVTKPGRYVVMVEGIGISFPFTIGDDVYEKAYTTAMQGLYHQRCGCALTKPSTRWERKRCHHPEDRMILQSGHRVTDAGNPFKGLPSKATSDRVEAWGGYHDAGDWDRRAVHLSIADALMLAYEGDPKRFSDNELSLPERGNGVPDVLDEVRWGVDLFRRLQAADGGVGGGLESEEHPKFGEASWTDTHRLFAFAPDVESSFRYAASAAHLGRLLGDLGQESLRTAYVTSAQLAWAWAKKQGTELPDFELHAAVSLYRATGESEFHVAFVSALSIVKPDDPLLVYKKKDQRWGVWHYALLPEGLGRADLKALMRAATLRYAETLLLEKAEERGRYQNFDWFRPFGHGSLTVPDNLPLIAAHCVSGESRFLNQMVRNADVALGANALNICWMTGLGSRSCTQVLHIDSFYDNIPAPIPGIVPYGPMRALKDPSWTHAWGQASLDPPAEQWPCEELWTGNRFSPVSAEFTVHETIGPAAAAYAYLAKVR